MSVWLEKRNSVSPSFNTSRNWSDYRAPFSKILIFDQILPSPLSTVVRKKILTNLNVLSQLF